MLVTGFCVMCTDNKSFVAFKALIYLLPRRARKGVKVPRLFADARMQAFFLDYEVRPFLVLMLQCFANLDLLSIWARLFATKGRQRITGEIKMLNKKEKIIQ